MEEIKKCLILFPRLATNAISHDVLCVYFAVSLEYIILKRSLGDVLSKYSHLTNIAGYYVIGFVHHRGKPLFSQPQPCKLHFLYPLLPEDLISHIRKQNTRLNYQLFCVLLERPIRILAFDHQILMVKDKISKLHLAEWFLEDFHVPYFIRLQVSVSWFKIFKDDDLEMVSDVLWIPDCKTDLLIVESFLYSCFFFRDFPLPQLPVTAWTRETLMLMHLHLRKNVFLVILVEQVLKGVMAVCLC